MAKYQVGGMDSSSPGSPGIGGAISDAVDAVRKTLTGYDPSKDSSGKGGRRREETIDNDASTPSNAGRQAQSTDSYNKYG
jgi:hypothetical protein